MVKVFLFVALALLMLSGAGLIQSFDPMDALQAFGNTYCAQGGGLKYWSTGPEYNAEGYPCSCQQQAWGNWTWCGFEYECVGYYMNTFPLSYSNIQEQPSPPFVFTSYFDNNSTFNDTIAFSRNVSTTNSYHWSVTESFTVGYDLEVTAGLPGICEARDNFYMRIGLNSTQEQSGSDSQSWGVSEQIGVPANSTVRVDIMISSAQYSADFTMQANFDPDSYGNIWCTDTVNSHYEWFIPPGDFLDGEYGAGVTCNTGSCNITGAFTGLQGISVFVNVTQCALGQRC
jgi:hypothetical protein